MTTQGNTEDWTQAARFGRILPLTPRVTRRAQLTVAWLVAKQRPSLFDVDPDAAPAVWARAALDQRVAVAQVTELLDMLGLRQEDTRSVQITGTPADFAAGAR